MPRRRKRSSWGSNEDAGGGRRRLRFWADLHDGKGYSRHSVTIVGTRKDGDDALARIRVEHSGDAPMPTVGDLWQRFELPRLRDGVETGDVALRTYQTYERAWRVHVAPRWSATTVTDVRAYDLQTWILGLTKATGVTCRSVLKNTLEHALMLDLIPSNPAARDFRMGEDTTRERSTYTTEELDAIWSASRGTVCEMPFLLMAHGGLRVGEACGMPLDHVRMVGDIALVEVSVQLTVNGERDACLKNREKGHRYVGIPAPWSERIAEVMDGLPTIARYLNDDGCGEPAKRARVYDRWRKVVIPAAGVRYLPLKDLRPTFETLMHWDEDVPIDKMARILGHNPLTTLNYYDRPTEDNLRELALSAARFSPK